MGQETGTKIFEEFAKEIAGPIGMQDFSVDNCQYYYEDEKSMHPAYAFRMSARDMARFGLLYQRNGVWNGEQIIPKDWIAESTTSYSVMDEASGLGYGYLWNVAPPDSVIEQSIRSPFYYHTGIGVHVLLVVPELKLVLVHRVNTDGDWVDPGEALGELIAMIISARLEFVAEAEAAQRFQEQIERTRKDLDIPGMSVAVLQGQDVVLARGFGYADLENEIAATENTPYHIASLTKPFAAAMIMQLVEAGQLDLDDEMADMLKDVPFLFPGATLPGYASLCDVIMELGQDESGPYAEYRFLFQDYRCDSEPLTIRHHLTHTSQGTPGAAFRYNGFLFGLLTQVLEQVTSQPFDELLVERIIKPLEMADTAPNASEERGREVLDGRAKPYRMDGSGNPELSEYPEGVGAGAGIVSTVLDLARFDAAMDQNLIVSEASKETMFTPTLSNGGQALPYGLGWFVQEHEGVKLVWHSGHQPESYSALILKMPEKGLTMILLANSAGANTPLSLGPSDVLNSPFALAFINSYGKLP